MLEKKMVKGKMVKEKRKEKKKGNSSLDCTKANTPYYRQNCTNTNTLHTAQPQRQQRKHNILAGWANLLTSQNNPIRRKKKNVWLRLFVRRMNVVEVRICLIFT